MIFQEPMEYEQCAAVELELTPYGTYYSLSVRHTTSFADIDVQPRICFTTSSSCLLMDLVKSLEEVFVDVKSFIFT